MPSRQFWPCWLLPEVFLAASFRSGCQCLLPGAELTNVCSIEIMLCTFTQPINEKTADENQMSCLPKLVIFPRAHNASNSHILCKKEILMLSFVHSTWKKIYQPKMKICLWHRLNGEEICRKVSLQLRWSLFSYWENWVRKGRVIVWKITWPF